MKVSFRYPSTSKVNRHWSNHKNRGEKIPGVIKIEWINLVLRDGIKYVKRKDIRWLESDASNSGVGGADGDGGSDSGGGGDGSGGNSRGDDGGRSGSHANGDVKSGHGDDSGSDGGGDGGNWGEGSGGDIHTSNNNSWHLLTIWYRQRYDKCFAWILSFRSQNSPVR